MDKKKDLAGKLRTSGLRPTKQRLKLADYLFNREKTFHFTVENLDKAINKKNSSSHHHFYDEINNELTDIENSKIELKKFPHPPKGKSIKDVNVIIKIDNDNQKH